MDEWRIADAKNKFSELFNNALIGRIQLVHRRDGDVVIMNMNGWLVRRRVLNNIFSLHHTKSTS